MSSLLSKELQGFVVFQQLQNGLAIWLSISQAIDINLPLADAKSEKVSFTSAFSISHNNNQTQGIRLGLANLNNDEIYLGIKRLIMNIKSIGCKQPYFGYNNHNLVIGSQIF